MADITRADIEGAINKVTGAPTSGIVADITPGLVAAIDQLVNPKSNTEQRVLKPSETRKNTNDNE